MSMKSRNKVMILLVAVGVLLSADACMTFVVGRKASATGRVIVGHNEDDWPPLTAHHGIVPARDWPVGTFLPATEGCNPRIPQVAHTLACYWGEVKFPYGDGNADTFLNEKGVLVVSDAGGETPERMDDPSLLTEGGIKFNLRRAVGERATSARDGVRIICEMVERYGYAPAARIYTVADRDEAWLVQVVHGRHYVAVRCPDDEVTIMPNLYTVYELEGYRPDEIRVSPGLVENARTKGFWDGKDRFNFAKAYQGSYATKDYPENVEQTFEHPNNTGRFRQAIRLLTGREWPKGRPFPFSVKPAKGALGVDDLRAVLTAHNGPLPGGRHVLQTWSICSSTTIESEICVFAADARDNEMQVALGRGCEKPYLRFRPFREGLPAEMDESATAAARLETHVRKVGQAAAAIPLDVEFAKGLISIPSESRSIPECNRAVAYMTNYLASRGVYCHVERTEEGRDAFYASTVPGKTCEYAFVSHIDVVPAASPEQFVPKIVGDEIYGRGACDTKVNAALIAQVLVALKGKASVGAFIATDEDGCVGKVPTCTLLRRAGYAPTKMILVGDTGGGETNKLRIAQKGHWGFRLTAKGRGGHSSIPWKLDNAIPKIVVATERILAAYPKPPPDGGWCSTLAPTILSAGDAPNSIPGEASVTFSFRYVGKNDVADLTALIRRETGLEPETLYCVPPVVNDPNDPLVRDLFAAMCRRWPDKPPELMRANGATDAFQFTDLNLPIVIYAPDSQGGHKPVESGSLRSAEEYLNFLVGWLRERASKDK